MRNVPVLVVTGYSGSGKTTLIERLVAELGRRGYRTGVVKHHRHPVETGSGRHDSERLLESGAVAVGLVGDEGASLHWPALLAPGLADLAALMDADVVLAEGYKSTAGPRLIVYGGRPQSVEELAPGREVVAVVGEVSGRQWPWPNLARDDVVGIADCIEAWLMRRRVVPPG